MDVNLGILPPPFTLPPPETPHVTFPHNDAYSPRRRSPAYFWRLRRRSVARMSSFNGSKVLTEEVLPEVNSPCVSDESCVDLAECLLKREPSSIPTEEVEVKKTDRIEEIKTSLEVDGVIADTVNAEEVAKANVELKVDKKREEMCS